MFGKRTFPNGVQKAQPTSSTPTDRSIKRPSAGLRQDRRVEKAYGAARSSPVKDLIDQTDREFFASFASRPGMYTGFTDLHGVVTYIEGYVVLIANLEVA